jgi:hypothetical protein
LSLWHGRMLRDLGNPRRGRTPGLTGRCAHWIEIRATITKLTNFWDDSLFFRYNINELISFTNHSKK